MQFQSSTFRDAMLRYLGYRVNNRMRKCTFVHCYNRERKPVLAGAGPGLQTRRAVPRIAGGFDPHWLPPIRPANRPRPRPECAKQDVRVLLGHAKVEPCTYTLGYLLS